MSAPVDISAQRCQRLVERLRLSATGSVTLHHTHYRRDCGDAAALILALRAALDAAERERDGANALVERMHAQDVLAIKQWQEANPGNDLVWPDNMRLTAWCMGEVAKLSAFRGQISDVLAENDALRFTLNNARLSDATGYARGVKDAAGVANELEDGSGGKVIPAAILALLPATDATKETRNAALAERIEQYLAHPTPVTTQGEG